MGETEATRDLNDEARDDARQHTSQAHGVETLEIERTRALTSLKHLIRSNEALEGELAREDESEEVADARTREEDKAAYARAIDENKRAIANVQERIYALSREIAQITGEDVRLGADDGTEREVNGGQEGAWV